MNSNLIKQPYPIILNPHGGGGSAKPAANAEYHVGEIGKDPVQYPRTDLAYKDDETGEERLITSPIYTNNSGAFVASKNSGTIIQPYMKEGVGYSVLIKGRRGTIYESKAIGDPGNLTDKISELTDIVYKASDGKSAVDNMISGNPLLIDIGGTCQCENGTIFKRIGNSSGGISDFTPMNSVNAADFGAVGDGIADDTAAIQAAIDSSPEGSVVRVPCGVFRADGLILKNKIVLVGEGQQLSIIRARDGWDSSSVLETESFDTYWNAPMDANAPRGCGLKHITIEGNADNFAGTPSAAHGLVVRFAAGRPELESIRIQDGPGIGLHTGMRGAVRTKEKWFLEETILGYARDIRVFGCVNDGWIFSGLADLFIESAELGVNGWPDTTYTPSRPSLFDPNRRVANLHITVTSEWGWLHSFGCREGYGVVVSPKGGIGNIRFKWDTLIAESCDAGVRVYDSCRYQGSILDVHNCYGMGGNSAPYFLDESTLFSAIDNVEIVGSNNENNQRKVVLTGDRTTIGNLYIVGGSSTNTSLLMDGYSNEVSNCDIRKQAGTAIGIASTATAFSVRGYVDDCETAANFTAGTGYPVNVNITSGYGNTNDFVGFENIAPNRRDQMTLNMLSSPKSSTDWVGELGDIPADKLEPQSLTIPINALYAPDASEVSLQLQYESGNTLGAIGKFYFISATATEVRFQLTFNDITGVNPGSTCKVVAKKI